MKLRIDKLRLLISQEITPIEFTNWSICVSPIGYLFTCISPYDGINKTRTEKLLSYLFPKNVFEFRLMTKESEMTISEAAKLLGFSNEASFIEIKKRYHALLKQWHPDVSVHSQKESHEMVIRLKEAYDILVNYCMNYPVSFRDGDSKRGNISRSMQYWHEHFGDDPIWG